MDSMSVFSENFFSMARMLGRNRDGALLTLPSGTIAAASGYPSAGENYLLLSPQASEHEVREAIEFFNDRGLSFVAPIFPGASENVIYALEKEGIAAKMTYTAMTLDLTNKEPGDPGSIFVRASTPDEVLEWGQTVWEGFGGEGTIDAPYMTLVRHMVESDQNDLYMLCKEGEAVCCGLLHHNENGTCGLYYFATKPIFRRKGYARQLMDGMVREAALGFSELVLLATPAGLPFYKDFGFVALADVPIRSRSTDI